MTNGKRWKDCVQFPKGSYLNPVDSIEKAQYIAEKVGAAFYTDEYGKVRHVTKQKYDK